MTTPEIVNKIRGIKEGFQNGDFNSEETTELLDDLICEIEECEGPYGSFQDDDHYGSFEETDFTKLEVI